jgi:3-hydroxybutyryl-CoA dehydratase
MTDRFAPISVGPITREAIRAYAQIAGDENPIHLDDQVAQAAGFPGVIAHGTHLTGILGHALGQWELPWTVHHFDVQFVRPVPAGTTLVLTGRIVQQNERHVIVRLQAKDRDGQLYCVGAVEYEDGPGSTQ